MKFLRKNIYKKSKEKGAVSIEMLIVMLPCIFVMFLFFNLVMILGNSMLTQAVVNRAGQQVAALGCVPTGLTNKMRQDSRLFGITNQQITFVSAANWDGSRSKYIDANGNPTTNTQTVPSCANASGARVRSRNFIYTQLRFTQKLAFAPGISSPTIDANSLTLSTTYER